MKMKIFKFFVLLSILFSSFAHAQEVAPDSRGYIVKVGDSAPNLELLMLDGSIKKLSEFNSPVIVLNFFASWCGVCRKEIPHIEKEIWQPFKDKGVAIIGVNFKEKPDVAQKAKSETGMTYPVALDTAGKIFEQFARGGVTRNIVLDKNLKIIFLTRLFDTDEFEQMKSVIHKQLNIEKEEATKTMNKNIALIAVGAVVVAAVAVVAVVNPFGSSSKIDEAFKEMGELKSFALNGVINADITADTEQGRQNLSVSFKLDEKVDAEDKDNPKGEADMDFTIGMEGISAGAGITMVVVDKNYFFPLTFEIYFASTLSVTKTSLPA